MKRFKIYAGLGGGYGGARFINIEECENESEASEIAYQAACDDFESHLGSGMDGWDDFIVEAKSEIDEDDYEDDEDGYQQALAECATEIESEARESWITYYVKEIPEGIEVDEYGEPIE